MSNSEFARSGTIITTVYEVLRKSDPARVACVAFPGNGRSDLERSRHFDAVSSYASCAVDALMSVSPDMDQSADGPIDLADPCQLDDLRRSSWPKSLGRRVAMPADSSCSEWSQRAGLILGNLCAL